MTRKHLINEVWIVKRQFMCNNPIGKEEMLKADCFISIVVLDRDTLFRRRWKHVFTRKQTCSTYRWVVNVLRSFHPRIIKIYSNILCWSMSRGVFSWETTRLLHITKQLNDLSFNISHFFNTVECWMILQP